MADIEKMARMALERADRLGAEYVDFRYEESRYERLDFVDGTPQKVEQSTDRGFGIRVIADGAWGFYSSAFINQREISRAAEMAVAIAKASALINKTRIRLAPKAAARDFYRTPLKVDPFEMTVSQKLDYLRRLDDLVAKADGSISRESFLDFKKTIKFYCDSEGSEIRQELFHSGAGLTVTAIGSGRARASRSFPSNEGLFLSGGWDLIEKEPFADNIPRLCEEARAVLAAPECPSKVCDIVLDGSHLGLVIHESIGHALELDRVLGSERNFSGASFATPDKVGRLKYGSEHINVVCDSAAVTGLGSFGYDDEGVKAVSTPLIVNGILSGYLSSRETAYQASAALSASMVAEGWGNIPLIRMTNTNLMPGQYTLNDLIGGIDDGVYMETSSSWSIDDMRQNFQFGCQFGRLIEGGKLTTIVKNPIYTSDTVDFWNSCDGLGDASLWRIWGTPNCGKGQPGQNARTGQGASPGRFRRIKVGR